MMMTSLPVDIFSNLVRKSNDQLRETQGNERVVRNCWFPYVLYLVRGIGIGIGIAMVRPSVFLSLSGGMAWDCLQFDSASFLGCRVPAPPGRCIFGCFAAVEGGCQRQI